MMDELQQFKDYVEKRLQKFDAEIESIRNNQTDFKTFAAETRIILTNLSEKMTDAVQKIDALSKEPGNKWNSFVMALITGIVLGGTGYFFGKFGR